MSRFISHIPEDSAILCEGCGYIVSGLPADSRCPECAKPIVESLGSTRRPSLWEQDHGFVIEGFLRTTAAVIFRPKAFFRGLTPRGRLDRARWFARVHISLATALFGWAALLQFGWLGGWPALATTIYGNSAALPVQSEGFQLFRMLTSIPPFPIFWLAAWLLLAVTTRLAARLSAWESAYRGLRLPLPVITRALHYHSAHYLPVALIAFLTVWGYQMLLELGILSGLTAPKYLYFLCAEVILAAAYLFKTYWTGMRNLMYANA